MNNKALPAYLKQSRVELASRFSNLEAEAQARLQDFSHLRKLDQSPRYEARYGLAPENKKRNRYVNVIPWDHTRVKLPVVNSLRLNDYLNASWVDLKPETASIGDDSHKRYIATQGPLDSTVEHFWHMAYNETVEVGAIVMLTTLEENGVSKCAKYWSDDHYPLNIGNQQNSFAFGLDVSLQSVETFSHYVLREFKLTPVSPTGLVEAVTDDTPISKTVYHFYFKAWEDFGNPTTDTDMLTFIEHVNGVMNPKSPLIVHCSAGIGRSGTFIAIDYMIIKVLPLKLEMAVKGDNDPIYYIVNSMREQRPGMVQRLTQYTYIYEQIAKVLQRHEPVDIDFP